MSQHRSEFITRLLERQFMHQCTDLEALDARAAEKRPMAAYIGFDCTAPSLHVGSLVSIMLLRLMQQCGHKPIVLMGGGTTRVGDPSGKDESRKMLDRRRDCRQHGRYQERVRKVPDLRRRADRCGHGQQRRLA